MTSKKRISAGATTHFRKIVWAHYKRYGRHTLPWRQTKNPYRILVSEVMLQQTQVDRVIPYYRRWVKRFPTFSSLANATLRDVLVLWQGLGYNRRAKMLYESARMIVHEHKGRFPKELKTIERLRGVGPYTARAVLAFSYNQDVVFIETNIRTAVLQHFFPKRKNVSDTEIANVVSAVLPHGRAREWYSALMDYGAYLKQQGVRTNHKVKGYTKQKAFVGSDRQTRGAIIRALLSGPSPEAALMPLLGTERATQIRTQLRALEREGLVERHRGAYRLPS